MGGGLIQMVFIKFLTAGLCAFMCPSFPKGLEIILLQLITKHSQMFTWLKGHECKSRMLDEKRKYSTHTVNCLFFSFNTCPLCISSCPCETIMGRESAYFVLLDYFHNAFIQQKEEKSSSPFQRVLHPGKRDTLSKATGRDNMLG